MHSTLQRQLRRLCGINSAEELNDLLSKLASNASSNEERTFLQGLASLTERVSSTYDQYERDLDLRSRSLEHSSIELTLINEQMRQELQSRKKVLDSVKEATAQLLEFDDSFSLDIHNDELEHLSAILPVLVAQQEKRRIELYNQRYALDQHAIVSIADIQGKITYANDKFLSISGYTIYELEGKDHRILNSGTHSKELFTDLWNTIGEGRVWNGEICNRSKNGQLFWVDSTIVPFLNDEGLPYQYISIRTDITHQKLLAQKIATSEKQYRNLVNKVTSVIFQLDTEANWKFVNPAWTEITGIPAEDIIGHNFLESIHLDDLPKTTALIQQLRMRDLNEVATDIRIYNASKQVNWFECTITRDLDADPQLLFTGTLNDITERRRIGQMQSEFVSVVSHELRTPLTSIRGSLSLLEAEKLGHVPEDQLKLIKIASRNCQRLTTLVNDILDMEKLMAGKMTFSISPLNLNHLIDVAIESNTAYANTLSVGFHAEKPTNDIMVLGDANRTLQVFANLLSNAAKFSPKDKAVVIKLEIHNESEALVSVTDYGPGIPLEFRQRIFSAFAQADGSNTRQQGGTGLGLSICKKIIENMNGRIGYASELGHYTRFWFTLPIIK